MCVENATSSFKRPWSGSPRYYSFGGKNFPFKPLLLGSYWFDLDEKNMGRARRALSNDPGLVLLGAIVPEKKIVKEKFFFPLFPLNRYNSAPIGPICT
ncbi:LOW QUALITY PROTEIN: hypothetical protein V1477_006432 [Vespula maculifrons]|uniref:Uncharacterized protein n=1 Tax=Vespula maculifrons TaxID=7453 RepID=A0ABD2CL76_VESMC